MTADTRVTSLARMTRHTCMTRSPGVAAHLPSVTGGTAVRPSSTLMTAGSAVFGTVPSPDATVPSRAVSVLCHPSVAATCSGRVAGIAAPLW